MSGLKVCSVQSSDRHLIVLAVLKHQRMMVALGTLACTRDILIFWIYGFYQAIRVPNPCMENQMEKIARALFRIQRVRFRVHKWGRLEWFALTFG